MLVKERDQLNETMATVPSACERLLEALYQGVYPWSYRDAQLVAEPNQPRGTWPLGSIVTARVVRAVTVRTK